jgi:TonB family protein
MVSVVFLILMAASPSAGQEQVDLLAIARKIESSVVSVVAYDKDGKVLQRSTGFFASDIGDVLTRGRTLPAGTRRVDVTTIDGKIYPITAIAVDYKEIDVVRLWARIYEKVKPLEAATLAPQVGDRVVVISMPQPDSKQVVEGTISGIEELETGRVIQVSAILPAGSSGSPVVNSRGEVIGVALYLGPDRVAFSANGWDKVRGWANALLPGANSIKTVVGDAVKRVTPIYPPKARASRITGTVFVQIIIDKTGKVRAARAISGPAELRDAAVAAAYQWKFEPTVRGGVPIEVMGTVNFNFKP